MRLTAIAVAATALALSPAPAAACGSWGLEDLEIGLDVDFLIIDTSVSMLGVAGVNFGPDYFPDRLEIREDAILLKGERIGTVRGDDVELGGQVYRLEIRGVSATACAEDSGAAVLRGETTIARTAEGALEDGCFLEGGGGDRAEQIRVRLILYLIWRQRLLADVATKAAAAPADPDEVAVAFRRDMIKGGNYARIVAALAAAERGPEIVPIAAELARRSTSLRVIMGALLVLQRKGTDAAAAVPTVLTIMNRKNWRIRAAAFRTLASIAKGDPEAAHRIARLLNNKGAGYAAYDATRALVEIGVSDEEVLGALLGRLRNKYPNPRADATVALGKLARPEDAEVVAALREATQDRQPRVRDAAARALAEIEGRAAAGVL